MKTEDRFKIYSRVFFAYIIIYHLYLFYVITFADVAPPLKEGIEKGYIAYLLYIIFIILNKSILYYRQTSEDMFSFWVPDYPWSSIGRTIVELLGFIKSVAGIIFYTTLNYELFITLYRLPEGVSTTTFYTIMKVNFYVFIVILVVWDFARLSYFSIERRENIKRSRQQHLAYAEKMEKDSNRKDKSDKIGLMTGYEPNELEDIELVSTSLMKGSPGAGLSGSTFSENNIRAGGLGELNFAKVLQKYNYLERFSSYWSVQYPFEFVPGPDSTMRADIDCILISKKVVYLLDIKLYAQGNITWKTINGGDRLQAIDNQTGDYVGRSRSMSRNMYYATKRINSKLESLGIEMKVEPYVVMMPTNRGLGKVEDVFWPGDVECMTIIDFLTKIEKEEPYNNATDKAKLLDSIFTWLLKDESGNAPRYSE